MPLVRFITFYRHEWVLTCRITVETKHHKYQQSKKTLCLFNTPGSIFKKTLKVMVDVLNNFKWERMQVLVAIPQSSQSKKKLDGSSGHNLNSERFLMPRAINSKTNPERMQTLVRKHMLEKSLPLCGNFVDGNKKLHSLYGLVTTINSRCSSPESPC